jgi:CO/xanthine dehydrogenase FAD-binding subunit
MGYFTPTSLEEALDLLRSGDATILAGGTDVYPALAGRDLPASVVDISRLRALRGITETATGHRIGALTRWSDIRAASLPPAFDGLRQAAAEVGGVQIQNAGTLAGNLCNASPAADGIPPLLTLDATVELASAKGTRSLPLTHFLTGPRATRRAPDEVLTAIEVPAPPPDALGVFEKLGARRYLVISVAMVAAILRLDPAGRIAEARIAVGACSPVALRLTALEADLIGQSPEAPDLAPHHFAALTPIEDPRGTASYRIAAARELVLRAIRKSGERHG